MIKAVLTCITLIFLIISAAFFASSETAFWSLSKVKLRQMLKNNRKKTTPVIKLKNKSQDLLTLILIGNNFVCTFASALATSLALEVAGARGVGIATATVTVLMIIFGETLPKNMASLKSEQIAQRYAPALSALIFIFKPLILIFNLINKVIIKFFSSLQKNPAPVITEEELKTLIDVGDEEGTLENGEKEMLYKIFEFTDLRVKDICTHRSLVKAVPENAGYSETIKAISDSGFSRLPVYRDSPETLVGLLHYKDVLTYTGSKADFLAKQIMRPILFVPETLFVVDLLQKFRSEKRNFVAVINEHGSFSGIVTMDDITKAVFGRITDEYNARPVPPEERIRIAGSGEFLIPGDMLISDVNSLFTWTLDSEDCDTIGGWLLEQFGYLPSPGEKIRYGKTLFIVEEQNCRRIQSIRIGL